MKILTDSNKKPYINSSEKFIKSPKKLGMTITDFIGNVDENNTLQSQLSIVYPDFTGIEDIGSYALYRKFSGQNFPITETVEFPDLKKVSGAYALYQTFQENKKIKRLLFPKLETISGSYALYNVCTTCINLESISFPELTLINGTNCLYQFTSSSQHLISISFPKLTTIIGTSAMALSMYSSPQLNSVSFPELTTIIGNGVFNNGIYSDSKLTFVSFPKLSTIIGNNVFQGCFQNDVELESISFPMLSGITGQSIFTSAFLACAKLKHIYFNSLTTSSFGANINQFNGMFNSGTGQTSLEYTMHFPSNLSSTIQGLTGYPNFGGTAGRLTLAFDLPATS